MRSRVALLTASLLLLAACGASPDEGGSDPDPGGGTITAEPSATESPAETPQESPGESPSGPPEVVDTVATGLRVPWGITFLPDGTALVGERDTGRVVAIPAGGGDPREVGHVSEATPSAEGGLLGLAASPSYDEDRLVFAYYSTGNDNRVVKMTYDGRRLGDPTVVLDGIPTAQIHDGGRLLFDEDGNLFVSTGEAGNPPLAQDRDSLGGKILHITPEGDPAPGNPDSGSPVWSWGHRNVQGLAFDDQGRLWATEFGANDWDELNLIERGQNYGWPQVEGRGDGNRFRNPEVVWRTDEASPSGLAYLDGHLWAASLRGQRLWRIPVTDSGVGKPRDFFVGDYGRLRTVTVAPDGNLWVTTSNHDGRGDPRRRDDRILVVRP